MQLMKLELTELNYSVCKVYGEEVEQVREFKYLGAIISAYLHN